MYDNDDSRYSPAVVENPLLSTPFRDLLLLLLFDLGGLRLYFAGTGEGSVNCIIIAMRTESFETM